MDTIDIAAALPIGMVKLSFKGMGSAWSEGGGNCSNYCDHKRQTTLGVTNDNTNKNTNKKTCYMPLYASAPKLTGSSPKPNYCGSRVTKSQK